MASEPPIDETLPEVVQDFLRSGVKLDEIRLSARGEWTHEGLAFENRKVIALFSKSVDRTEGGTWVLRIGQFTYPIVVEDTGFFVEKVDWSTTPATLSLSDGTVESLQVFTLSYQSGGRLYTLIKEGSFQARFLREAYYSITNYIEERHGEIWLSHGGEEVCLGRDFEEDE